ncbi:MAG: carboxypeptidase regulatory-like domain-containing protein [Planctomyces sp.]|nr:carboxypeptidase regulatory-like domain-containing protein [Planctomyces sp.]
MKRMLVKSLYFMSAIGMVLSTVPAIAAEPLTVKTADVALSSDGVLKGTVLTAEAQPISGATIEVLHGDKKIASVVSDEEGQFAVKGLRNGAHVIQCANVQQPVRFWTATASAPPSAIRSVSLVVNENTVRGQQAGGGLAIGNLVPFAVIGGVTAIVVGTTLDESGYPAPPASP